MKKCTKCKSEKNLDEYNVSPRNRGGFSTWCKQCTRDNSRKHYEANKSDYNKKNIEWVRNNHEKALIHSRKYAAKAEVKEYRKQWAQENRGRVLAAHRRWVERAGRSSQMRDRRVQWADSNMIETFYRAAKAMDFFNPCESHEVDHVIPLRGKTVSGLHVQNNLQILTKSENASKGNRY